MERSEIEPGEGLSPWIETPSRGHLLPQGEKGKRIGSDDMAYKNFKVETDADGIALVTWDIPGRSMNVLDETSTSELDAIVKETTADAAVKGVVITSAKEAFCAG